MPYKRVIAFGDSFTRGDELTDCPEMSTKDFTYSQSTWPALVAKSLNCDYECYATGGRGNQWISWQVSGQIKQDTLYIVNWSWFERFDYVDIETDDWRATHPRHADKLDHYFYRNLDSDIWNLHRNLQQMHSTISLLKQNNIDFIITCLDPHYSLTYHDMRSPGSKALDIWTNAISSLQKQILPNIVDFEGMSFLEWSKHKNFELGPNGHPLEQAHLEAANYILDKYNKYLYNKRIK
jgi:hypothetical protein